MRDSRAYWSIRLTLGVGLWLLLFVGVVMAAGGPSEVAEDIENGGVSIAPVIFGGVFGALWENIVAAGVASWVVYDSFRVGAPPVREESRDRFDSDLHWK